MKYFILFFIISCSINHDPKDIPNTNLGSGGQITADNLGGSLNDECVDGEKRHCHITISNSNGVNTCFIGFQICNNKNWSLCAR
jgi:hypothetical protein